MKKCIIIIAFMAALFLGKNAHSRIRENANPNITVNGTTIIMSTSKMSDDELNEELNSTIEEIKVTCVRSDKKYDMEKKAECTALLKHAANMYQVLRYERNFEVEDKGYTWETNRFYGPAQAMKDAGRMVLGEEIKLQSDTQPETTETSDAYGKTTTTVTTGSDVPTSSNNGGNSSSDSSSSSASSSNASTPAAGGSNESSASGDDKDKADDKDKKEEDINYTGIFNGRQIVPNTMAIYCKVNAEDMLKESAKLYNCVNDIARQINDSDAAIRAENLQRFEEIRYEELKAMMAQAVAKGAAISNYESIQNEIGDASGKTKTEHEDNVAITNSVSTLTDVINTMRDLYAERLKNEAISGIKSIDPKVIKDIAEQEDKDNGEANGEDKGSEKSTAVSGKKDQETDSTTVTITEENPDITVSWKEGNSCARTICVGNAKESCHEDVIDCPDNVYPINGSASSYMVCMSGNCQKYDDGDMCNSGTLPEQSGSVTNPETGMCGDNKCQAGIYTVGDKKFACYNDTCIGC